MRLVQPMVEGVSRVSDRAAKWDFFHKKLPVNICRNSTKVLHWHPTVSFHQKRPKVDEKWLFL